MFLCSAFQQRVISESSLACLSTQGNNVADPGCPGGGASTYDTPTFRDPFEDPWEGDAGCASLNTPMQWLCKRKKQVTSKGVWFH